ncbi:MAG: Phosphopantothenoylcysteine synthetase/decarboxylase [Verrucomicrobiota bacterium]
MPFMKVIITCGPAYEPIDGMRRITNASTGELGLMLAQTLSAGGHEVLVFKGEMASSPLGAGGAVVRSFSTNDDLLSKLRDESAGAVFHAAALCDFRVAQVMGADGASATAAKIPTRAGQITLTLKPAVKVLPQVRAIFPGAFIAGWKYELDGDRASVVEKALRQLGDCSTDACVVNGAAWGDGFGIVRRGCPVEEISGRRELCGYLLRALG